MSAPIFQIPITISEKPLMKNLSTWSMKFSLARTGGTQGWAAGQRRWEGVLEFRSLLGVQSPVEWTYPAPFRWYPNGNYYICHDQESKALHVQAQAYEAFSLASWNFFSSLFLLCFSLTYSFRRQTKKRQGPRCYKCVVQKCMLERKNIAKKRILPPHKKKTSTTILCSPLNHGQI